MRAASVWTSQPSRIPGRPYVFESDETEMTCGPSVAASGGRAPKAMSR